MQFTKILCTLVAGACYGTSSPAPDGNCSSASENIALIQRQASVQAHAADPSPELTSVEGNPATWIFATEGHWGDWGTPSYCPGGGENPIVGVRQKVEHGGVSDKSGMNAVQFVCRDGTQLVSSEGRWGSWGQWVHCSGSGHMVGLRNKIERKMGGSDDTAVNDIEIYCSGPSRHIPPGGGAYGDWTAFKYCPGGWPARGFFTKVEADQGGGDDSALNGIGIFCESTPAPTPYPTTPTPTASPTPYPTTASPTSSPTASPTQVPNQCANILGQPFRNPFNRELYVPTPSSQHPPLHSL